MLEFFLFILVIVIIGISAKSLKKGKVEERFKKKEVFNYSNIKYLMSKAEVSFYGCLNQIINNDDCINSKVRMADVLKTSETNHKKKLIGFRKISSKHFDYVITDKKTGEIKYAVELDDKSHETKKGIERDTFVDAACKSAGLKLVRVKAQATYNLEEIKKQLGINPENENEHKRESKTD